MRESIKKQPVSKVALARVKKAKDEGCACYVLITCSAPEANGQMEVEMEFEGDEDLAALLIENASQVFHERFVSTNKKHTKA